MSIKIISNYLSDDESKSAMVYLVLETREIQVSVMDPCGSSFFSTFETVEDAEKFAESWVSDPKNNER